MKKMRRMKEIIALALSLLMMMAMGMTAFATELPEEETAASESANPAGPSGPVSADGMYELAIEGAVAGHSYEVYQIFTGDVAVKDDGTGVLSNIKYGKNAIDGEGTALTQDELEAFAEETDAVTLAKDWAEAVVGDPYATLNTITTEVTVPGGYYLIKDVWADGDQPEGEAFSDFVISIVGATSFKPKTISVPVFEKTSENEATVVSDKSVGDTVSFTLKATLPSGFSNFDEYKLVFHDELSAGLSYVEDTMAVKVNGNTVDVESPVFAENILTYEIEDVFTWGDLTKETAANAVITIEYQAEITADAIERTGEENTASIEYTNNPSSDELGKSTEGKVTVLLVQLDITKVDGEDEPLSGAGFTLYRYDENKDVDVDSYTDDDVQQTIDAGTGDNQEKFLFGGLGKGQYLLVESTTPAGYNTMEPVVITVDFESEETENGAAIESLSVSSEEIGWNNEAKVTAYGNVINRAGIELPSTGGIGTTIFYVVGGIMVLGACILLVTKKRMASRD